ncbi:hypothetical protein RFI_03600 [Reticulomyxa filosa]|uniref:Uncharacterized protein n=1 Tax=Reticulomyxa filosa TaxID=46433 RepID=X6P787_RETFI|nr:hypothetical protein RFI_03600 [Reticulomyxa filosa]|eukprot:ETO33502.1 hypothetical protein RFI_03600 [Reticulomyxa filosa]
MSRETTKVSGPDKTTKKVHTTTSKKNVSVQNTITVGVEIEKWCAHPPLPQEKLAYNIFRGQVISENIEKGIYDDILEAEITGMILKDLGLSDIYQNEVKAKSYLCQIKRNEFKFMEVTFDSPWLKSDGSGRGTLEFESCVDKSSSDEGDVHKGGVLPYKKFFTEKNMAEIRFAIKYFETAVNEIKSARSQLEKQSLQSKQGQQLKKKKSQSEEKSSEPHGIVELSKGNEPTTFTISMNTSTKFKFIFPGYAEDFFVNCKLEDEQGVVNITHSFNVAYKINKQDHQKSLDFTKKYKDPSTTTNDKGSVMDEYEIGTNISGNFFRDKNMPDPKTPYKLFLQAEFGQNGIITRIVNADNDDEKNVTTKNTLFPMHNQAKEVAEDILFCVNILETKILSNLRRMDRTDAEYNTLNQAKKCL